MMEASLFANYQFKTAAQTQATVQTRTEKEALIADIIEACTGSLTDKRTLAKRLAITANVLQWTIMDFHALYAKRHDPKIRNYTAFVTWTSKVKNKL